MPANTCATAAAHVRTRRCRLRASCNCEAPSKVLSNTHRPAQSQKQAHPLQLPPEVFTTFYTHKRHLSQSTALTPALLWLHPALLLALPSKHNTCQSKATACASTHVPSSTRRQHQDPLSHTGHAQKHYSDRRCITQPRPGHWHGTLCGCSAVCVRVGQARGGKV